MKTGVWIFIALSFLIWGCPAEKAAPSEPAKKEAAAAKASGETKDSDKQNPEELPEDVKKKLKSLGYVQ